MKILRLEAWLPDTYRPDAPVVLMGRNGRPRNRITLPGHGAGVKPPNTGLTYPADPPTPEEMLRLIAACPNTKAGVRNRALITVLWRSGLRISEALDLLPHHVDFNARTITVMSGKGGKRRTSGTDAGALAEVSRWLMERARLPIDQARSPLFCTIQKPGVGGHLHDAYVRTALKKLAVEARIPKRLAPHQFRHAHAVELAREKTPIRLIQLQLGHASLATTATYLSSISAVDVVEVIGAREWPS